MATMTNAAAPAKVLSQQKSAFAGNGRALAPARVARVAARNVAARAEVKEIHMPALSSTMTEGKIVSWLKGEGEQISKGEAVVVVESDKADMDVETFYDGYLAYIAVPDGEMATVGAPIAFVAETEAEIAEAEGVGELTDRHWEVLEFMRKDFAEKGTAPSIRRLKKLGVVPTKELYALFPGGPAKKASKIAGLPKPKGCV